jgi:hypothetical protein
MLLSPFGNLSHASILYYWILCCIIAFEEGVKRIAKTKIVKECDIITSPNPIPSYYISNKQVKYIYSMYPTLTMFHLDFC